MGNEDEAQFLEKKKGLCLIEKKIKNGLSGI